MNAIIFGINSQDGFYLKEILQSQGISVIGVSRSRGDWEIGTIANYVFVSELIKREKPNYIFHFAANSTTQHNVLFENHDTISTGTLNILESVKLYSPGSRVFITGSGLQFKNIGIPIKETDEFDAKNIYSVARIQSVYAARYYRTLGLKIYVGYLFHHDSPLRNLRHLNMAIVEAAKRIKNGSDELIEIGNPYIIKEFNHASDIVKAIWLLVNQENVFEAVIGSGVGKTIQEWIDVCFTILEIQSKGKIQIIQNFVTDFSILTSNPETIRNLGWVPKYNMVELAKEMMK